VAAARPERMSPGEEIDRDAHDAGGHLNQLTEFAALLLVLGLALTVAVFFPRAVAVISRSL
jgi:hypothetical protein